MDFSVCRLVIDDPAALVVEGVVYAERTNAALTFFAAARDRAAIQIQPCAMSPGRLHWWRFRMNRAAEARREAGVAVELQCEERVDAERAVDFALDGFGGRRGAADMRASLAEALSACGQGSPAMGASARAKVDFPPVRVNIVEEGGWSRWDPAGDISNWASDNASDDWHHMDVSDCMDRIGDLVDASMPKRERARIGPDELQRICDHLAEDKWSDELEATVYSIQDANQWAWEEAYTPNDGDIEYAMEKAGDRWDPDFGEDWNLVAGEIRTPPKGAKGPKEWVPQVFKWDLSRVIEDLLKHVTFSRKPGWYDRYITFDFGKAEVVRDLLDASAEEKRKLEAEIRGLDGELARLGRSQQEEIRREQIEGEIRGFQEEIDGLDDLPERLKDELRGLADDYLGTFFRSLEDVMEDAEPSNKFDVREHWKSVLGDESRMKGVRKELLEFLKKPAPQQEED